MKNCWSLRLSEGVLWGILFIGLNAKAQFSEPDYKIPAAGTYMFPIKPGEPASLAGTMGELRNTHFHSGIDIRTNNEIGWPVYAANDGYISRATITPSGFGLALFVTHPDGHVTVYGHLDRFNQPMHNYVRNERYRRKTSSIDLYFRKDQFKVNQGDIIGFAGNTGSSDGPHLHFDIREGKDVALDPLKFKFEEVTDNTAPVARKIALKTLDLNSRINDQFGRFEFYVTRTENGYILPQPILAYGNIGIELLAYDIVDNPRYKCGVNHIDMFVDSQRVFNQTIDRIDLKEPRFIYTLMDYKTLRMDGSRFYKLYVDDGNQLNFYPHKEDGRVRVSDDKNTQVSILLKDTYGNSSTVSLNFAPSPPVQHVPWLDLVEDKAITLIQENTLIITTKTCSKNTIAYTQGEPVVLEPAYLNSATTVFLLDLRKAIPDSITLCTETFVPAIQSKINPGTEYDFYSDQFDIHFPKNALYDTLYFSSAFLVKDSVEIYRIGSSLIPLNRSIKASLKPTRPYPDQEKSGVYRLMGNGFQYEGGIWQNNRMNFLTREFGAFTILTDSIPPVITPIQVNRYHVRFKIRDGLSGVSSFEATLNGRWLLLNHDGKSSMIKAEPAVEGTLLQGDLELIVTDNAGNKQVYKQKIL